MKNKMIKNGVWPTMLTPFTKSGKVDYSGLERLVEWYVANGVQGLFAVCQSSEMFYLTTEERVEIARFVVKAAAGRVQVIASGHVSDNIDDQVDELERIAGTGVDAVVLVSNRLAGMNESDDLWKKNTEIILNRVDAPLGIYECPYPYKRLMNPDLLHWCAATGRFYFLKDTCCDTRQIEEKLKAVKGTDLKIYNANSATLLETLKIGVEGYSGVMANFHPDLYVWLCNNWSTRPEIAEKLQSVLGLASVIEYQYYPVNAKYHLQLEGLDIKLESRAKKAGEFSYSKKLEVRQLKAVVDECRKLLNIKWN